MISLGETIDHNPTRQRGIHAQFLANASSYSIASRLNYTEFIDKTCLTLAICGLAMVGVNLLGGCKGPSRAAEACTPTSARPIRGRTPEHLSPLLKRLGLETSSWCELLGNFDEFFCTVAGRCSRVNHLARQR